MSWDADEREVREAVAEGDADRVWSMLEHAYEERDEANAALAAARDAALEEAARECEAWRDEVDVGSSARWDLEQCAEAIRALKGRRDG